MYIYEAQTAYIFPKGLRLNELLSIVPMASGSQPCVCRAPCSRVQASACPPRCIESLFIIIIALLIIEQ